MATNDVTIVIKADGTWAKKGFKDAEDAADRSARSISEKFKATGQSISGIGQTMTMGLTVPIVGLGIGAFKLSSDLNEAMSKVDVVFKNSSGTIHAWSENTATSIGIAKSDAEQFAGAFGNIFTQLGMGTDEAAAMSIAWVQLAADVASFNNLPTAEVMEAMQAATRGEYDALQAFAPMVNAAAIETKALAMTGKENADELTAQEEALALNALMFEQTTDAQGDYARTAEGAANKQKSLTAQFKDAGAELGDKLIPIGLQLMEWVTGLIDKFNGLSPTVQTVILWVGGLAAVLGPVLMVVGGLITGIGAIGGVLAAIGAPILLVIAAVAALAAGLWWLYNNNETFRNAVQAAWEWISTNIPPIVELVVAWVTEKFGELVAWAQEYWPAFQEAITHIFNVIQEVFNHFVEVFSTGWQLFGDEILTIARAIWDQIYATIEFAINLIAGIIETVTHLINGDWGKAWESFKGIIFAAWDWIRSLVSTSLAALGAVLSAGWDFIRTIFSGAWSGITGIVSGGVEAVVGFIAGLPGRIAGYASGMFNGILDAWRSVINGIIGAWNSIDFGIDIRVPGWVPGVGGKGFSISDIFPDIPYLAKGGTAIAPGLAVVGENGPELLTMERGASVIPLDGSNGHVTQNFITVEGNIWSLDDLFKALTEKGVEFNERGFRAA